MSTYLIKFMDLSNSFKPSDKRKKIIKEQSHQSSFYRTSTSMNPEYTFIEPDGELNITENYYVSMILHLNKEISALYKLYCKKVKKI